MYVVLSADLFNGLVAKTGRDAKAAHNKKHGVIVAYQIAHFVGSRVEYPGVHVKDCCLILKDTEKTLSKKNKTDGHDGHAGD